MPSTLHGNRTEGHRGGGGTGLGNAGETKVLSFGQPDHRKGSSCENQVVGQDPEMKGPSAVSQCDNKAWLRGLPFFNHNLT